MTQTSPVTETRAALHHLLTTNIPGCLDGSWEGQMLRPDKLSALVDAIMATAGHAQTPADTNELLERADEYLGTIANKGNCGPHHLVSDLAAALRGFALSDTSTDRGGK